MNQLLQLRLNGVESGLRLNMAYVYILENKDAKRIKVGATVNHPDVRLIDISRMWGAVKGRCQICLKWRILENARLPKHVLSGNYCAGSSEPPFEFSTNLAERYLDDLLGQLPSLNGSNLNFATKRANNLKKIINNYKVNPVRIGTWELSAFYKTDFAYQVEKFVHQALAAELDNDSPFGEVFTCSLEEAIKTVESNLLKLSQNQ